MLIVPVNLAFTHAAVAEFGAIPVKLGTVQVLIVVDVPVPLPRATLSRIGMI